VSPGVGVMPAPELDEMETTLAGVPALIASVGPRAAAAQRGTILLLHGRQRAWGEVIDWFDLFLRGSPTIAPQLHGDDRV
jgi:hypothetical protein